MAQQQPDGRVPAGVPDRTRVADAEASTVDAPARWSGSAAVPPPGRRGSRRLRRLERLAREEPAGRAARTESAGRLARDGSAAGATIVEPADWAAMPAVDPWAGQDTEWDPAPPFPAPIEPPPIQPRPIQPLMPSPAAGRLPAAGSPPPVGSPSKGKRPRRTGQAAPAGRPPALPAQRPLPPPPPARRHRHRWRRRFLLLTVVGLAVYYGFPAAARHYPPLRQYPVTADLPGSFSDLSLRDDDVSRRAADRLAGQLRDAGAAPEDVFAGVYGDDRGKRVTVFGVTGWRLTPGSDVRAEMRRLADDYGIDEVTGFHDGVFGAYESCGVGRDDGSAVVVCAWADHGSLATVLLTRRSLTDSADLVRRLRSVVLTPA